MGVRKVTNISVLQGYSSSLVLVPFGMSCRGQTINFFNCVNRSD